MKNISILLSTTTGKKEFELPKLPYERHELEPYMSKETIDFHYEKHLNAYITNTNTMIKGTEFEDSSLEDIVKKSEGGLFNNSAQASNHNLFFMQFQPNNPAKEEPDGKIKELIDKTFGSFSKFKEEFKKAGVTLFGSGWVWLILNDKEELEILQTSNANTPIREGRFPILNLDVWEHSYYIDTRNDRGAYIENFWKIINWDFVNQTIASK